MAAQPALHLPAATYPAGVFTSPQFAIPSAIAKVIVAVTVSAPDISDPTKSMTFELYRRDPNDANSWLFDHGFTWHGNALDKDGVTPVSPVMVTDVGPLLGQVCHIRLALPFPLTAAIDVSAS